MSSVTPVKVADLVQFLQYCFNAGGDVLFLSFTLMCTGAVAVSIRRIFLGAKQS